MYLQYVNIGTFFFTVSRWVSKQHLYVEGDIPPAKFGENLTVIINKLIWQKYKISIQKVDIAQIHRIGRKKVIIRFNDLREESAFRQLLKDHKWDHKPT